MQQLGDGFFAAQKPPPKLVDDGLELMMDFEFSPPDIWFEELGAQTPNLVPILEGFLILDGLKDEWQNKMVSHRIPLGGNSVALVGKNGSGKTHLLRMMVASALPLAGVNKGFDLDAFWNAGFLMGARDNSESHLVTRSELSVLQTLTSDLEAPSELTWREILPIGSVLGDGGELFHNTDKDSELPMGDEQMNRIEVRHVLIVPHQMLASRNGNSDKLTRDGWLVVPIAEIDESNYEALEFRTDSTQMAIAILLDETMTWSHSEIEELRKIIFAETLTSPFRLSGDVIWAGSTGSLVSKLSNEEWLPQVKLGELFFGVPRAFLDKFTGIATQLVPSGGRDYLCPFCQTVTSSNFDHIVVWANEATDTRRHLHRSCFMSQSANLSLPFSIAADPAIVGYEVTDVNSQIRVTVGGLTVNLNASLDEEIIHVAETILLDWNIIPGFLTTSNIDSETNGLEVDNHFQISLLGQRDDSGNWDRSGTYIGTKKANETACRWITRALQVAILIRFGRSAKIVIWDEPELGLHPQLVDNISNNVLPSLEHWGIKIVFATHSLSLARSADSVVVASELHPNIYRPVQDIDSEELEALGFNRQELLLDVSKFILVEGKHDSIVLENLFAKQMRDYKCKILPFGGTPNLRSIASDYLLFNHHDAKLFVVLDGGSRSLISRTEIKGLNSLMSSGRVSAVRTTVSNLLGRFAKSDEWRESFKLLSFVERIANLEESKAVVTLKRVEVFMLQEDDIIYYLKPSELFSGEINDDNWNRLKEQFKKHRDDCMVRGEKPLAPKKFYREVFNPSLKVSDNRLREASIAIRERGIQNGDLQNLKSWLFS